MVAAGMAVVIHAPPPSFSHGSQVQQERAAAGLPHHWQLLLTAQAVALAGVLLLVLLHLLLGSLPPYPYATLSSGSCILLLLLGSTLWLLGQGRGRGMPLTGPQEDEASRPGAEHADSATAAEVLQGCEAEGQAVQQPGEVLEAGGHLSGELVGQQPLVLEKAGPPFPPLPGHSPVEGPDGPQPPSLADFHQWPDAPVLLLPSSTAVQQVVPGGWGAGRAATGGPRLRVNSSDAIRVETDIFVGVRGGRDVSGDGGGRVTMGGGIRVVEG